VPSTTSDLTFQEAKEAFLQYCRIRNLAPATLTHYTRRLNGLIRFLDDRHPGLTPSGVDLTHLRERIAAMMDAEADITSINHYVAVAKTFFVFLAEECYIESNPAARLQKLKDPKVIIKTFSAEEIEAILAQPNKLRFSGTRDYLMMLLLLDTGLRISEAMCIKLKDIDRAHSSITVMGKGSKERTVHFGQVVRRAMNQYLERRGDLGTDYLFVTEYGQPMQSRMAQGQITRYGRLAGIQGVRVSPHTFRHTFAKNWIVNGGDVFSLQKMLGHTTMEMVRRYVNLASEDVSKAHRSYSPADHMLGKTLESEHQQERKRLG
jgi:integrase/recombinase XerD